MRSSPRVCTSLFVCSVSWNKLMLGTCSGTCRISVVVDTDIQTWLWNPRSHVPRNNCLSYAYYWSCCVSSFGSQLLCTCMWEKVSVKDGVRMKLANCPDSLKNLPGRLSMCLPSGSKTTFVCHWNKDHVGGSLTLSHLVYLVDSTWALRLVT